MAEHQPRAIFDDVLRQIDAIFPHERARDQVGDTYALRADAAKESLVHLIRHACRRLLTVLHAADVERHACVIAALDRTALFGAPDEHRDWYLTDAQRAARVQTTVLAALDCTRLVRAQLAVVPPWPNDLTGPILDWLDRVDKIIADEVILAFPERQAISAPLTAPSTTPVDAALTSSPETPSALSPPTVSATAPPIVTERPAPVKGADCIGSATDPDATYRVHTHTRQAGKTDLGYNVSVLVSADAIDPVDSDALGGAFIREVHVDTGAQPDAVALPDLLVSQRQFHDLIPSKVIYDTAAGSGKTRHLVALATDLRTQLVARLSAPLGRRTTDFGPEHFTLSANGAALTCPHGLTTSIAYRSGSGDGRDFRFLGSSCVDCPLWSQCRTQPVGSRAMRQVFISDYRDQITAARAYNATLPFKQDMKHRAVVERVIAALVRYNGARHARRRGLTFADFQVRMNATAYNLKRWMRLLALRELAAKKPAST